MRLRFVVMAVAAWTLFSRAAQAGDPALAEALFQKAKQLKAAGDYGAACPKFEASYRADRTLGTLLNLADCHEHVGKSATAWAEWNEAIELAKKLGDDRVAFATERRDKLWPRLAKLELKVTGRAEGLHVYRGNTRIAPGAYNSALPVDPGKHEITVRRDDDVLERRQIQVKEGQSASLALDLGAIDRAQPAVRKTRAGSGVGSDERETPSSTQKTIGFIVGGVGIAALATAGVLELVAISNKHKADEPDQCVNKYCSSEGLDNADRAKNLAEIGQWVALGGLVATGVGVALILTAPSAPERETARARTSMRLTPWLGPSSGGLGVSGSL
jgi:tetratricopeptide (TPR) repeat protein